MFVRQGREVKGGMGSVLEGGRARVRGGGGSRHRDGRGMWGQQKVKWRRVLETGKPSFVMFSQLFVLVLNV